MANVTIPDITALAANVAAGDLFEIADISNANASRRVTQLEILQGLTITPAASTLAIAAGKVFTCSNTLTFTGTDSSSVAFGTGGTVLYSGGALGTPSGGTLTNATGLPVSTGISGLGTGVATFLATPSSANLASAITGETGSGALVFATSPALTTPNIGTPSAGTLTSCTGLPVGGISATGTPSGTTFLRGDGTWSTPAGSGDFVGPASSTDNAVVLFDGATGKLGQNSTVLIDPITGDMTGVGDITGATVAVTTLSIGGTTITATGAQINASAGAFTPASASGAASMALAEDTDNGSNTVSIAAPAAVASNKTATLQDVTGTLYISGGTDVAVADGGTGLSSGTSGGVLGFTASGTIASSAALAANAIVIGGGAGATPTTTTTGTGVVTALGVNVGSAGAFVTFNGAGGTPSSLTLTNATGLPASAITAAVLGGTLTLGEGTGNILLDNALSADGTWSGISISGTAGATLAFGDLIYFSAVDSRWELADASAATTAGNVLLGICVLAAAADGNATTVLLKGMVRADTAFPALTISAPVYVSETAGDVTGTAPTTTDAVIRVIGFGFTADVLYFSPDGTYITHV